MSTHNHTSLESSILDDKTISLNSNTIYRTFHTKQWYFVIHKAISNLKWIIFNVILLCTIYVPAKGSYILSFCQDVNTSAVFGTYFISSQHNTVNLPNGTKIMNIPFELSC